MHDLAAIDMLHKMIAVPQRIARAFSRAIPLLAAIMMSLPGQGVAQDERPDRTYEGHWYVMDDTDNNTGERKVSAFQLHLRSGDPDYVTLRIRCSSGRPALFIEWAEQSFPDQTVVTIDASPGGTPDQYVFSRSDDPVENGLRATPEVTGRIIAAIGQAAQVTITARPSSGTRSVVMEVDGTQRAWSRVVRHCPVQVLARPPL